MRAVVGGVAPVEWKRHSLPLLTDIQSQEAAQNAVSPLS